MVKDYTGRVYGRWTVIRQDGIDNRGARWLCRCECGNEKTVRRMVLMNGESNSCGCLAREKTARTGFNNRKVIPTGTRIGRLVVQGVHSSNSRQQLMYLCKCDCGNETVVAGGNLRNTGHTQSCGCLHNEGARKQLTKHGLFQFFWYRAWWQRTRTESEAGWTTDMEKLLYEIQPACIICGRAERLSVDHVLPASKAHALKPGNAVVMCLWCNQSKGNKDLSQLPREKREKIERAAKQFLDAWNNR